MFALSQLIFCHQSLFLWFGRTYPILCMNVAYSHNTTVQIYRCREIRNTDDSPLFRYKRFINFLTLVFRHEERETFLLCWPRKRAAYPVAPSWTRPAPSWISTNVFFKITKFSAYRFQSFTPRLISYLGFLLWHLWLSYPLRTSMNICTKSRIVQSPTKPNDRI